MKKPLLFLAILFVFPALSHAAYNDEIAVDKARVWQAAILALEPYGIARQDAEKGVLESKWIEDFVQKPIKFLPEGIKRGFYRRYRLTVKLKEESGKTLVEIKGKFQQKPTGQPPSVPWHSIRPKTEDYEAEKLFFGRLMAQLNRIVTSS